MYVCQSAQTIEEPLAFDHCSNKIAMIRDRIIKQQALKYLRGQVDLPTNCSRLEQFIQFATEPFQTLPALPRPAALFQNPLHYIIIRIYYYNLEQNFLGLLSVLPNISRS